jgi:iron only hydrogenase large subunit-like protein
MSKIKSPHEISSIIIKELFNKYSNDKLNIDKDLYICSVMSCFDKKIEPIRYKTGINTVISTIELEEKFKYYLNNQSNSNNNKIIDINILINCLKEKKSMKETKELIKSNINNSDNTINFSLYDFPFNENYSSNFYIEFFTYMIMKENPKYFIERKDGRNIDTKEIIIYSDETKKDILYKFLISYGLRNIQNIVRMIKSKKIKYDYVEMMACPGGCINGAGQIRVEKTRDDIFKDIKNGFENLSFEEDFINKSINNIGQIVEELKLDSNAFSQSFKEADFSKSDIDW